MVEGFEDKRVYVWIDALLAYVTASKKVIEEKGQSLREYWNNEDSRIYLVHERKIYPFTQQCFQQCSLALD